MWTTLALAAALGSALGQTELTITNVRATYGALGPARQDNKILPGDTYFLLFDVDGFQVADTGKVGYTMAMEVTNSQGKTVYGQEPRNFELYNTLGGSRLHGSVFVNSRPNDAPGEYNLKVTVTDRANKASQTLMRKFEIMPKDFGLVGLTVSYDGDARHPAPPAGMAGQQLFVSFGVVGFERDRTKKQPDIVVEMRVLDESGRPTVPKPFTGGVNSDVGQDVLGLPMSFLLTLSRGGKFTVELKTTDNVSRKTSNLSFPLMVTESK